MTPTNREELVELMALAGGVPRYKVEAMLYALIGKGLAVAPVNLATANMIAMHRIDWSEQ